MKAMLAAVFFILAAGTVRPAGAATVQGDTVFYHGTVMSVAGENLVISEYDSGKETQVQTGYTMGKGAVLENMSSLADLKQGDLVGYLYLDAPGSRTVINLIRYPADVK